MRDVTEVDVTEHDRPTPAIPPLPATEREVAAAAAGLGMTVPPICMPGVIANLALLGRHAAILRPGTVE